MRILMFVKFDVQYSTIISILYILDFFFLVICIFLTCDLFLHNIKPLLWYSRGVEIEIDRLGWFHASVGGYRPRAVRIID